jgi:hypothetical protein
MLTILATWWRGLRRWGIRRRTDRALHAIATTHQAREQQRVARAGPAPLPDPDRFPRIASRGHRGRPERRPRGRPPPSACCLDHDNGIVTACDGVTDTVICGVCRTRFERPCPDGPIRAPVTD